MFRKRSCKAFIFSDKMSDMSESNIMGAFGDEQVSRLTNLSRGQLSNWRRSGFVKPSIKIKDNPRSPYSFAYSFKDY